MKSNFKMVWLGDPKKFEGFNPDVLNNEDFDVQEYANFENNGDGKSFYVYLRDIKSGVYKKALKVRKVSAFIMLFTSTGANNLVSIYGFLDSNSAMVIQVCNYLLFTLLFFGFNIGNINILVDRIRSIKLGVFNHVKKV